MIWAIAVLFFAMAFVFSLLGLGGGIVYMPVIAWLGYDVKMVAIPTALLLNALTTASASVRFLRKGMVDLPVSIPIIGASFIGAPVGAYLTTQVETDVLLVLYAFVLVAAAIQVLRTPDGQAKTGYRHGTTGRMTVGGVVGIGIGLLSGFLGVAGGILIVPLLLYLGYSVKVAVASSAFIVAGSSVAALLGHIGLGHFDWEIMLYTGLFVIAGGQLGSYVIERGEKSKLVTRLFAGLLVIIAAKLLATA